MTSCFVVSKLATAPLSTRRQLPFPLHKLLGQKEAAAFRRQDWPSNWQPTERGRGRDGVLFRRANDHPFRLVRTSPLSRASSRRAERYLEGAQVHRGTFSRARFAWQSRESSRH